MVSLEHPKLSSTFHEFSKEKMVKNCCHCSITCLALQGRVLLPLNPSFHMAVNVS